MNKGEYKSVVLIGYSGHTLVAAEALMLNGYKIKGYLEKNESTSNLLGIEYLGFEQESITIQKIKGSKLFPSIGDNYIREKLINFFSNIGFDFINAIHPNANISEFCEIGNATLVSKGCNINPFAKVGNGVILNTGSIIEHECIISDYAHIAPGAVLAGNVKVGRGSFIGSNSVIKQGVNIGNNVIIGAGSVVLNDVEDNLIVVGNPAKSIKK